MYVIQIVLQGDILVGTLTVQENLLFSAALRLPASYTWEERKKRVNDIICELGLEKIACSKVRMYQLKFHSINCATNLFLAIRLVLNLYEVFLVERENVPALEWNLSCLQILCSLMSPPLDWTLPLQYQ